MYHHAVMSMTSRKPIPFDNPARYKIQVQGQIDPGSSDLLGGMAICPVTVGAGSPVTNLEGEISDQAALAGVLTMLYELHLTILSVERVEF
jgi:hypothetical protein